MGTFEERQQQYEQNDVPAAWRTYVASGIRKKFANQFDFGTMSDQEVIQRHHGRFGAGMDDQSYKDKLDKTYGTGFTAPPPPKETLGERAQGLGEAGKEIAKGLVPFVVPEVGKAVALKAGAKAVATKIPVVSQIGFLGGHAINVAVDTAVASALEQAKTGLPVPDEDTRTQEYYAKLKDSLTARGYTDAQIMQEASARAQNVTRGYQKTIESIDQDIEAVQQQAITEPAKAAADAFFLGVGAPLIEGALQKGLAKVGLIKVASAVGAKPAANMLGTVASHIKTGVIVGAPGIGIQSAISAGILAAAENKTPDEIGKALIQEGIEGIKHGAVGGAIIGGLAGTAEVGIGAAIKPLAAARQRKWSESRVQVALDDARLRGWQEEAAALGRGQVEKTAAAKRASIARTADDFNPHTTTEPIEGDPAEVATTIIQQKHGDEAALSEAGLRAASKIEERLRLYQDANADIDKFAQRELPPTTAQPAAPEPGTIIGAEMPPTEQAPGQLGLPLGPVERGGRTLPPPAEINPRLGSTPPAPQGVPGPSTEAPVNPPAPAPVVPAPAPQPVSETPAGKAISQINVGSHAALTEGAGGSEINLERLGLPAGEVAKPGATGKALDDIVAKADEHQLPITTAITQVAGPRGGHIPIEKLIPWYEKRGFKVVSSTKLPEGTMSSAVLRREPVKATPGKIGMMEAEQKMMEKLTRPTEAGAKIAAYHGRREGKAQYGPQYATKKKMLAAKPGPNTPSTVGYVYHATNLENAEEIVASGLKPHRPWFGTDQHVWPDGTSEMRAYFIDKADRAWQFAPEHGHPVILRMRETKGMRTENTGDRYLKHAVPATHLQILTEDGTWFPLAQFFTKGNL